MSNFKKGISAKLPSTITVSHKFGERRYTDILLNNQQLHDCGIVYKQNAPYILCIMTKGNNQKQLANTIQDISFMVYSGLNSP